MCFGGPGAPARAGAGRGGRARAGPTSARPRPGPEPRDHQNIFFKYFCNFFDPRLGPFFDHFLTTFSQLFGVIIWEGPKPPFDHFFTTWFGPCKNQFFTNLAYLNL